MAKHHRDEAVGLLETYKI